MCSSLYQPLNKERVRELTAIFGENGISSSERDLSKYSHDQVSEKHYAHAPEVVVFPTGKDQIVDLMKLANRHTFAVTPRGAGSGLSGGAVPVCGGVCMSLERMNRILEIDLDNLVAVVEPGVVTHQFDAELQKHGLFFAGYPLSKEFCFLGGNVAENAGGGRAVKYGVTRQYIAGLEVVTPTGDVLELGSKRFKDVTGYDLLGLMVGSEGTLGTFTKIYIKLMPKPKASQVMIALFASVQEAIRVVPALMIKEQLIPSSIEFIDAFCLQHSCASLKETIPWRDASACLLLEVDGNNTVQLENDLKVMERICRELGAFFVERAKDAIDVERFWKIRSNVPWALKRVGEHQSMEDVAIPIGVLPKVMERLEEIGEKYGILMPSFGHAGDGNLHATPIKPEAMPVDEWRRILPEVLGEIYRTVGAFGGTISGEHGIGHKRMPYLPTVMGETQLKLMRGIKKLFDPNNILNPGKIVE